MSKKGLFLTFEGNEGAGKTTQIKLLYALLKRRGYKVFLTREPGGTVIGDQIRGVLLDAKNHCMTPVCETLLYMASRAQLVEEVIKPKLRQGYIVLCDRWLDATVAYQGFAGSVDHEWIRLIGRQATGGLTPHKSIYLDLPVREGLRRATSHKKADRLERKALSYHKKVRKGYLWIAAKDSKRFCHMPIHPTDTMQSIHQQIVKKIEPLLVRAK